MFNTVAASEIICYIVHILVKASSIPQVSVVLDIVSQRVRHRIPTHRINTAPRTVSTRSRTSLTLREDMRCLLSSVSPSMSVFSKLRPHSKIQKTARALPRELLGKLAKLALRTL